MMDENIKKIRAMVEGMLSQMEESKYSEWWDGVYNSCKGILSLLSGLEKSLPAKVADGEVLEEEINRTYHDGSVADTSDIDHVTYENIAEHFYDLGCRRTAEKYDEIEYNRQRASGSSEIPKDREEAAREYAFNNAEDGGEVLPRHLGFIAGSKWQTDHTPLPEDTVLFNKGVEEGKRLMMEEAVEIGTTEICWVPDGDRVFPTFDPPVEDLLMPGIISQRFNGGDKVRVIIVKEDEK